MRLGGHHADHRGRVPQRVLNASLPDLGGSGEDWAMVCWEWQ